MPILASALTKNGINLTYTESVDDLDPEILALYDGLIIYANHETISPQQEEALLDFVAAGHAFIPVHSASFCFHNSPQYIDLVGAQFKSHKTGTFTAVISDTSHAVTRNMNEFSTWDETYVHDKIADDIQVLMERVEGDHREPWTWVKDYKDGRVFYTAYGHDERTWNNPGFHELIKNGILWAVGKKIRRNWEVYSRDIPPLEYREETNIPNYEKRDPPPQYQLPLSPEESKKLIQVPAGFEIELFAAEPDVINPIAMNWDEKGRLWLIETVDYPNTVRSDPGIGDDRIKICEDTDGDGKADKFTIFAEDLNIPTSFVFSNGGIIVSQAPYFLFLQDTDGDDRADVKETFMEGWGIFDTHAGPSNLQNGIDNQIYGVVGYSGFEGNIFGTDHKFAQGIYRFSPHKEQFEFLTNTSNNTWGLGISEDNSIFASTANNTHSVYLGIPDNLLAGVAGMEANGSKKIDGHYAMSPITPNVRQVDVFGGFTAAAGHHFYTARAYPENYWNQVAFICEPTGNLVHIAKIEADGAGYREVDGGNLMASSDEWVSPVEAKVGPDGMVWVADWYNFIIQHNPTPRVDRGGYDAENGAGNAHVNPLRDRSKGRIWRIVPRDAETTTDKALDPENSLQLIDALSHDNMYWRMTAQRLLVERGEKDVLNDLYALVKAHSTDRMGNNPGALHALWTISGLTDISSNSQAREVVIGSLNHPAPAVRRAAIQILPKSADSDRAMIQAGVLADKDPKVVLNALIYTAQRDNSQILGKKLYEISKNVSVVEDEWLSKALYAAASHHSAGFISSFMKEHPSYEALPHQELGESQDGEIAPNLVERFVANYLDKTDLTGLTEEASAVAAQVLVIRTIPNEMKYSVTEIEVEAGKPVQLVFQNNDFMQHNLVITQKGEKDAVGKAADQMATDPNGLDKDYVPDLEEVLYYIPIVDPDKSFTLEFTAPEEPGNYPYICTFPGHWRIMQGNMKVVREGLASK